MMVRLLRSVAALAMLLGGLVAVPLLLLRLDAHLFPSFTPDDPAELVARLLTPDDGSLLAALFLVIAWAAWAVFAVSVLLETVNLLTRERLRLRLPGLGGPQRLVAGLLLAVVALGAVPSAAHAAPTDTATHRPPVATAPVVVAPPADAPSADAPSANRTTPRHVHVVVAGDDLWSLADHYYGEGRQWRRIAAANPDRLSGGPDRLQVGARLVVPGVEVADGTGTTVTVAAGDSLSRLAEAAYGDSSAWPKIFRANRDALSDPDEIEVGTRLVVPSAHGPADHAAKHARKEPPAATEKNDQPAPTSSAPTSSAPTSSAPTSSAPTPSAPTRTSLAPGPSISTESSGPVQPSTRPTPVPVDAAPSTRVNGAQANTGQFSSGQVATADDADRPWAGIAAGMGGLLAAGLAATVLTRRRQQLAARPVGRRILHPGPATQAVEAAVGRRGSRVTRDTLDRALRAVGAHARVTGRLPLVELVRLSADGIELVLATADPRPPVGFTAQGRSWKLDRSGGTVLRDRTERSDQAAPYPLLVTLGTATTVPGQEILVDLEQAGLLRVAAVDTATTDAVELALGTELALAPWADEITVTVLGRHRNLVKSFDRPEVRHSTDVDAVLDRLELRQGIRRSHLGGSTPALLRLDPDLAASWGPEVVLVTSDLTDEQRSRFVELATAVPQTALAVVLPEPAAPDGVGIGLELRFEATGEHDRWPARLHPFDMTLDAQRLLPPVVDALADLLATTTSPSTTPAPWWDGSEDIDTTTSSTHSGDEDDEEAEPQASVPRRAWASEEDPAVVRLRSLPAGDDQELPAPAHHPTVRLLGPIDLVGVDGAEPTRAAKQCLEYCTWLLEHPGATAPAMASALAVAESTRRSNMSRLRGWLGDNSTGEPHLPDAYSGRIFLDPAVSSDWQRLQLLTAPRVNTTSTDGLVAALELVRGAPLADAAPGQWHWAEELRTDMTSAIRDIGVELGHRAMVDHDLDLARWAANRALAASPEDERLLSLRLEIEHVAGNRAEVERLALRISGQARTLGVDLDPETVILLQEVMEGRPRNRVG